MQKRKQSRFKYHYFSFYYFQFKQNVVWVVAGFVCFYFFHIYMVISVNYLQIWQCVLLTSVILPVTVYMYIFTLPLYFLFLSMFSLLQSYSHRLTFRCAHTHTFKVTADIVFTTICNGNFWYSNETCGNLRLLHFFHRLLVVWLGASQLATLILMLTYFSKRIQPLDKKCVLCF